MHADAAQTKAPDIYRTKPSSAAAVPARGTRVRLVLALTGILGLVPGCTTPPPSSAAYVGHIDKVVVRKSQRQLELISGGKVVRHYHVALGGSPVGHKFREGDQRTPEGSYVLNWRNPNSNYYKAIHISYPNEKDRATSRKLGYNPGGMVMLHGMPTYIQSESMRRQYASRDWTQGCIALQNQDMDEVWRVVQDGTPIQIAP